MENSSLKNFIVSFFALFKAYVKEFKVERSKVLGIVAWHGEEDEQPFSWIITVNEDILLKIKLLCEFLTQHQLIQGDKIVVPSSELEILLQKKGWDINEAKVIIDELCSLEIKMVDDGEETDSFFVHF